MLRNSYWCGLRVRIGIRVSVVRQLLVYPRRMGDITPSKFAGHPPELLADCPATSPTADGGRRGRGSKLMRGARPGKPGRQTAAASRRTPREALRERARWLHVRRLCAVGAGRIAGITPSMFAGHGMPCPYEENGQSKFRRHSGNAPIGRLASPAWSARDWIGKELYFVYLAGTDNVLRCTWAAKSCDAPARLCWRDSFSHDPARGQTLAPDDSANTFINASELIPTGDSVLSSGGSSESECRLHPRLRFPLRIRVRRISRSRGRSGLAGS